MSSYLGVPLNAGGELVGVLAGRADGPELLFFS